MGIIRKFFLWIMTFVFAIISLWTAIGESWQTAILTGIIAVLLVLVIRGRRKRHSE